MGILDDTAIFTAIIQEGGFSHAAKRLGLSNGLISRRITQLEAKLGVSLIKRTTRKLHLTPEGEVFWQYAERIQQELNSAISLIQASADKPKGVIQLSAPNYFGRHYLTPILMEFLNTFKDIKTNLILSSQYLDPIQEKLDFVIRGSGYVSERILKDSSLKMKLLLKEKIGLYASPAYLIHHGEPKTPNELLKHKMITYVDTKHLPDHEKWTYTHNKKDYSLILKPRFNSNDIESNLFACIAGYGIGKFTELHARPALLQKKLRPILEQYSWGEFYLYAVYPHQQALPKRTRLLLDFISSNLSNLLKREIA